MAGNEQKLTKAYRKLLRAVRKAHKCRLKKSSNIKKTVIPKIVKALKGNANINIVSKELYKDLYLDCSNCLDLMLPIFRDEQDFSTAQLLIDHGATISEKKFRSLIVNHKEHVLEFLLSNNFNFTIFDLQRARIQNLFSWNVRISDIWCGQEEHFLDIMKNFTKNLILIVPFNMLELDFSYLKIIDNVTLTESFIEHIGICNEEISFLKEEQVLKEAYNTKFTLFDFLQEKNETKLLEYCRNNEEVAKRIREIYENYNHHYPKSQHYRDILGKKLERLENILSLDKITLGEIQGQRLSLATFWLAKDHIMLFKYFNNSEIYQNLTKALKALKSNDVKKHPFYDNLDIHKVRNEKVYRLYKRFFPNTNKKHKKLMPIIIPGLKHDETVIIIDSLMNQRRYKDVLNFVLAHCPTAQNKLEKEEKLLKETPLGNINGKELTLWDLIHKQDADKLLAYANHINKDINLQDINLHGIFNSYEEKFGATGYKSDFEVLLEQIKGIINNINSKFVNVSVEKAKNNNIEYSNAS